MRTLAVEVVLALCVACDRRTSTCRNPHVPPTTKLSFEELAASVAGTGGSRIADMTTGARPAGR